MSLQFSATLDVLRLSTVYSPVAATWTASFNVQTLYCAHTQFTGARRMIIALNSISQSVFVTRMQCVLCELGTTFVYLH